MTAAVSTFPTDQAAVERRILRRMREPGALLVVARDVPVCGVLVPQDDGAIPRRPAATCTPQEAVALMNAGHIQKIKTTRQSARFEITDIGRDHIRDLLAKQPRGWDGKRPDPETLLTLSRRRHLRRQGRAI